MCTTRRDSRCASVRWVGAHYVRIRQGQQISEYLTGGNRHSYRDTGIVALWPIGRVRHRNANGRFRCTAAA